VVCGPDGVAVFDALHRRHKASDAILYAFDLLALDRCRSASFAAGERKAKLAKLLVRNPAVIMFNEHTDEDGGTVFRHACRLGFEPYRSGPSRDWIKVKNPGAMRRAREGLW
jgi:bifunctional non-homologous end joining protein LigD